MTGLTVDLIHGHPGADSVRIEDGRFVSIGSGDASPEVRHVAGTMLPGLRDSHIHPVGLAAAAGQVDLSMARSFADIARLIGRHAAALDPDTPVIGFGLDDEQLAEARLPNRWELDAVAADRPVLVYRHCSHIAVANSEALAIGRVDDRASDPAGGRLRRDATGTVDGILDEAAVGLVSSPLADRVGGPDAAAVETVLRRLRRRGLVAIDAMASVGSSMWCAGNDEVAVIAALGDTSPVAIDMYVIADTVAALRAAAHLLDAAGPRVRFAGWKGFADGSLGGRTAALRAPYADDPSTSGLDLSAGGRFLDLARASLDLGGTAALHAIGDHAVDRALALAERLGPGTVRIEHASVVGPDQIDRMAAASVVASVQPSFVTSDAPWLARRLGPDRVGWAYPFRSMLGAGIALRGGSDAPIESADPFVGIDAACADRGEALDVATAIDMYADAPLAIGGPATFVVVDGDPARTPSLAELEVREVWIDGERVE